MALINVTLGDKSKECTKNKTNKKRKKKQFQYTKLVLNMIIILTIITTIASMYINFKNGLGLDAVNTNCWEALKYIIPSYFAKSFFETKEEKGNELIREINNINQNNDKVNL